MAWLMIPFVILMIGLGLFIILMPFVVLTFAYNEYQSSKRIKKLVQKDWDRLMTRIEKKQHQSL